MAYTKTVWHNDIAPAINETNLNNIENGIATNDASIGVLPDLETTVKTDLVSAINELKNSMSGFGVCGAIQIYAGATAPAGWLMCNGSAVSRTTYADLFRVIGETYGYGDGSTTFNLPNLKGKIPTGLDSSQTEFNALGKTGGEKTHLLTESESGVGSHYHEPGTAGDAFMSTSAAGASLVRKTASKVSSGGTDIPNLIQNPSSAIRRVNTNVVSADASIAHNNLQPYLVMNYIIKT